MKKVNETRTLMGPYRVVSVDFGRDGTQAVGFRVEVAGAKRDHDRSFRVALSQNEGNVFGSPAENGDEAIADGLYVKLSKREETYNVGDVRPVTLVSYQLAKENGSYSVFRGQPVESPIGFTVDQLAEVVMSNSRRMPLSAKAMRLANEDYRRAMKVVNLEKDLSKVRSESKRSGIALELAQARAELDSHVAKAMMEANDVIEAYVHGEDVGMFRLSDAVGTLNLSISDVFCRRWDELGGSVCGITSQHAASRIAEMKAWVDDHNAHLADFGFKTGTYRFRSDLSKSVEITSVSAEEVKVPSTYSEFLKLKGTGGFGLTSSDGTSYEASELMPEDGEEFSTVKEAFIKARADARALIGYPAMVKSTHMISSIEGIEAIYPLTDSIRYMVNGTLYEPSELAIGPSEMTSALESSPSKVSGSDSLDASVKEAYEASLRQKPAKGAVGKSDVVMASSKKVAEFHSELAINLMADEPTYAEPTFEGMDEDEIDLTDFEYSKYYEGEGAR